MKEVWRTVYGFEGFYQVSSAGRVRNRRGRILTGRFDRNGYRDVLLSHCEKPRRVFIHRIVLETFRPTVRPLMEPNHKNGNRGDNRLINLEWTTRSQNIRHRIRQGVSPMLVPFSSREEIRAKRKSGYTYRSIAKEFGCSPSYAWCIVNRPSTL